EFFHANFRDHLVREVLNGEKPRARGRQSKPPPAWRALDRLAAAARDWAQTQQPLDQEDVRALMEHKDVVGEHPPKEGKNARDLFSLLFLRDAEELLPTLCLAAKECFVFSALVREDFGKWAFKHVFPDVKTRVECCERWMLRCPPESRMRLIQ